MLLVPALNVRSARGPAYDSDALAYCRVSGATERKAISDFVRGVKNLGLWNDMVCWPLRSSQNAGTGTTAYSLGGLGTFNGTLTNGPTWGVDGVTMLGASSQFIDIGNNATLQRSSEVGLALVLSTPNTDNFAFFGGFFAKSPGGAGHLHNYQFQENAGSRNISFNVGDGVSATAQRSASIGATTTKQFLLGSARAGGQIKLKHNNNAISSTSNALSQFNTTNDALKINASGTAGFAVGGEFSFGGLFSSELEDANIDALYTLYKQTLGTGLGLP